MSACVPASRTTTLFLVVVTEDVVLSLTVPDAEEDKLVERDMPDDVFACGVADASVWRTTVVDALRRVAARAASTESSAFTVQKLLNTNKLRQLTKSSLIPFILYVLILADFLKGGQAFLNVFM